MHVYPIKWARRGSPSPRGTSKSNSASSSPCPTSNLPPSCQSNHATAEDGFVPRRTSAVLFVAPKDVSTPLEPVVMEGETGVSGDKCEQAGTALPCSLAPSVSHKRLLLNFG